MKHGLKKRPTIVLSLAHNEALLQGVLEAAHEFDWQILDLKFHAGTIPSDPAPAGAIINCFASDTLTQKLRKLGCTTVRIGVLPHPLDKELPAVLTDQSAIGRLAAEHFVERGFRSVGYVGHDPWSDAEQIYRAFNKRSKELDCSCHLLQFKSIRPHNEDVAVARYNSRQHQLGNWLADLPKPIGVLTYSDQMAGTLCAMCQAIGQTVPEDVSILGMGNDLFNCIAAPVELSSIEPFDENRGRVAADTLQKLLQGEPVTNSPIMIQPKGVIERRSTDVLAVPDPIVAQAIRFMWDHLSLDLSVDDVAEELGISRRGLERRFRRCLNRGINAEMRRKRLERCCALLRGTSMTIAEIAPLVGFRSKDYLHQAFRKEFDTSPRQYRLKSRTNS